MILLSAKSILIYFQVSYFQKMRDSFKCEFVYLGSRRCQIERDIRFSSDCIQVPIPDDLQNKDEETKILIPYEYIKNFTIFNPDSQYRGNHQYIS